tara:strand:+ start:547 stop:846 length:300 start_codon:yes stop_codon:yes gene_type:complete
MKSKKVDMEMKTNEIDKDGMWTTPEGEEVHITEVQYEVPDGTKAWPLMMVDAKEYGYDCISCEESSDKNYVLILDNGQYLYIANCCGQVVFCEDIGEDK